MVRRQGPLEDLQLGAVGPRGGSNQLAAEDDHPAHIGSRCLD